MRIGRAATADGIRYCQPEGEGIRLLAGDFGSGFQPDGPLLAAGAFRLSSPVQPGKVLVVLGAFPRDGDREAARATPPRFAAKLPSAVAAARDDVIVPAEIGDAVTIEPELAAVIGVPLRRATPADAADAVLGYTCMNDVTHLPFIREQGDFLRAKSVDTGTVMCLHAGSGGTLLQTSEDAPREAVAACFGLSAVIPAIDWLFALVPVRFPTPGRVGRRGDRPGDLAKRRGAVRLPRAGSGGSGP